MGTELTSASVRNDCRACSRSKRGIGRKKRQSFPKQKKADTGPVSDRPAHRRPWINNGISLVKRLHRAGFIISHIEDGVELGDLQQVVHFLGQVQQFEFAALVANRGKGAHQLTNA